MTTQQKKTEAEQALQAWGVAYMKQDDGTIVVEGDINICHKGLTKLPDLSKVIVKENFLCSDNQLTSLAGAPTSVSGNFWCSYNQLTSLAGAPASVGGNFWCSYNQLTSLAGAPTSIGGNFWCNNNQLASLTGAPTSIGGDFWCNNNQLTSLARAPASVGGDFWCSYNQLTSLAGAPTSIGEDFWCNNNQLTSLERAPQEFKTLRSDFGKFSSWNEVPENLRVSQRTKEKEKQARQEMTNRIGAASTQKHTFKPMPSIRFKAGPK